MQIKDSHCCYCGASYPVPSGWPRHCAACGNRVYANPLPVVVVLAPVAGGLVGIRRNIEPQRGTVTLPGGYIDRGETWQQAGRREFLEETGIDLGPGPLRLFDVMNGLDDTLIVFGLARRDRRRVLAPFVSEETQELVLIERPMELGFPMHTMVVGRYFKSMRQRG